MTMGYIGAAIAIISAATAAYTSVASAENAKEVADFNAQMQDRAAKDAEQRGAIAASEHRDKVRKMLAQNEAAGASSGLDANTGSLLASSVENAGMGELDALRLRYNAMTEASGMRTQASVTRAEGNNALAAGHMQAAGSILSGASSAVGAYNTSSYQQNMLKSQGVK